jgi:hypothetical protein
MGDDQTTLDDQTTNSAEQQTLLALDPITDDVPFTVPEKFMVKGADDQPDFKAIAEKIGQSYSAMEKRVGTGDIPPKSAEDYKLETFLPEGVEPNQEVLKPVLSEFHRLGLTQGQVQGVMNVFGSQVAAGQASEKEGYVAGAAALKSAWGDEYQQRLSDAKAGLSVYTAADKELAALLTAPKYANDPAIIRLLSAVGADLKEDKPVHGMDGPAADSIDEIRTSKAYLDPKEPGHADAVRKVNEAYTRGYKANRG